MPVYSQTKRNATLRCRKVKISLGGMLQAFCNAYVWRQIRPCAENVMQGDFWRWAQLSLLRPSSDKHRPKSIRTALAKVQEQFGRALCFSSFLHPVGSNSGEQSLRTARINLELASNRTLLRRMHIDKRRYDCASIKHHTTKDAYL